MFLNDARGAVGGKAYCASVSWHARVSAVRPYASRVDHQVVWHNA